VQWVEVARQKSTCPRTGEPVDTFAVMVTTVPALTVVEGVIERVVTLGKAKATAGKMETNSAAVRLRNEQARRISRGMKRTRQSDKGGAPAP
jgi:hypothetical protein